MSSISAWLARARDFVDGLRHLPGGVYVSVVDEPPVGLRTIQRWERRFEITIPGPLRELYCNGCSSCEYRYSWEPPDREVRAVENLCNQRSLYGGPEFIHYRLLGPYRELLSSWATDVISTWDEDEATLDAANLWRTTVPFIAVDNGDYLGFDIRNGGDDGDDPPIVYLCHDDVKCTHVISPSFREFLNSWEAICYLGPEGWMLDPYIDWKKTKLLRPDRRQSRKLRELFEKWSRYTGGDELKKRAE